jgi:hypothetical protein
VAAWVGLLGLAEASVAVEVAASEILLTPAGGTKSGRAIEAAAPIKAQAVAAVVVQEALEPPEFATTQTT